MFYQFTNVLQRKYLKISNDYLYCDTLKFMLIF